MVGLIYSRNGITRQLKIHITSALKRKLTKMRLSLKFLSNFLLGQFLFTSSGADDYDGLSQTYKDYLIRCVLGTFLARKITV